MCQATEWDPPDTTHLKDDCTRDSRVRLRAAVVSLQPFLQHAIALSGKRRTYPLLWVK